MANNQDDVIIVGSLSDKELRNSIDDLVSYVGDQTTIMAGKFTTSIDKMRDAMKDFAVSQKVSVDLMKEAWKGMSASFDAMFQAQSAATGSGSGGKGGKYDDNTVGALEAEIRHETQLRKEMQLGSDELRQQNRLLEERKAKLKDETTSDKTKDIIKARKEMQEVFSMPSRYLLDANEKLRRLQQLATDWNGKGVFDKAQWNRLQNQIQAVQEKIDKLKAKRPASIQDVLGMDENSVDAIAKKMAALKKLTIDPSNTAQVKQLGDEYQRLSRLQSELLGKNIQATHSNNYLAQSFGYIRNRIVYALTLGAISSFVKNVYEIRGQYELLERSLGVLVNSFERGSQIFSELNEMAIKSPFTLMELAGAAKQLTAYNFAANEVVDTTRRMADISAALGVPMERLTYNLGQIRAQTVLTARDARDFANAGLPIVKSLSDMYTELEGKLVTTGDVYDRMSKKMVSYNDVMAVLNKMTDEGGKFFDFQAKQAETLRVQMANLTLAFNNMYNEIGDSYQGLLTAPIQGLKYLLSNWRDLERVLKSVVIALGILKTAQFLAVRYNLAMGASAINAARMFGTMANTIKGVALSMKALALNPWTWVFVGILAITDFIRQAKQATAAIHEMNEEIRKNAGEASESMLAYLNNKGNKATRAAALAGTLTAQDGERAWSSLREQIEQSALSCDSLISELLTIDNINERVAKGFDYAERIQKAQAILKDLKDDTIQMTSDKGWFGWLGEGLVSDLKDFTNSLGGFSGNYQELKDILYTDKGTNNEIKINFAEFRKELDVTAESIKNFIDANDITDPLQINEILERVKAQIKIKNPEIKGEAAKIFDISLDERMATLTNGAVDKNASLWKMFMDRLRSQSSAVFQDISDDILSETGKLSKEQQDAVDKNLEYFKNSMPFAYEAVAKMVADASKLKIHIGVTFGDQVRTDFQKQVQDRINAAGGVLDFGNASMLPTANDDLVSWVKTQQKAIETLSNENKTYEKDATEWSKKKIEANNKEIAQRGNLLDLFNQSHTAEKQSAKGRKKQEDELAAALKEELSIIDQMRSNYDKLRKAGIDDTNAINLATQGYENTINRVNNVLAKFGVSKFNASNFAGKNVSELLRSLEGQRDALIANGKAKTTSMKEMEVKIQKLRIEAKAFDMQQVTKELGRELSTLKEQYNLALEFDKNPEFGNVFADMLGIDKEALSSLPRTFDQVLARLQNSINQKFADNNIKERFNLSQMLNTKDFDEWVKNNGHTLEDGMVKQLDAIRQYANKVRLDESRTTLDEWNKLISKYGDLQSKIIQIYKNAFSEQLSIINQFGTDVQKNTATDLINRIKISQDPDEITRLQGELAKVLADVTKGNAVALKMANASKSGTESQMSKAYWDDFKDSELYSMTFENMANNSTMAIQLIIDKMESLKDKVKEDPASMKALMKSLEDARTEMETRNPFLAISSSIQEWKTAAEETSSAQADLVEKTKAVEQAQKEYDESEDADPQTRAEKYEKLNKAIQDQANAELKVATAENKVQKSRKKLQSGFSALAGQLENVKGIFDTVSKLFRAFGDDDTADAIDAISEGFSVMTTIIMGVVAAMILLETTTPWLLAIAAALSVIVGLVSWLSGNENKKIDQQVEKSELAVKRLENSYKNLEVAIQNAYGASQIGARKAAIANKELQLAELQRQLQLEKSRDSKDRDASKIADLEGQIIDMKNEIEGMGADIVNTFLGISSVSDAVDSMMGDIIDALRNGEDAMSGFNDSIDDMIANMIKQVFSAKIVGPQLEAIWDAIQADIDARGNEYADYYAQYKSTLDHISTNTNDTGDGYYFWKDQAGTLWYSNSWWKYWQALGDGAQQLSYEQWKSTIEGWADWAKESLDVATTPTMDDVRTYAEKLRSVSPNLEAYIGELDNILREMGLIKDTTSEEALSSLQQGIQGVTEDTAGAIEAYLNNVSQQMYLQGDFIREIRDILLTFDQDVQVATLGQILLQLQQSYQVQVAIQNILSGWSNANGMAIRVEML